MSQVPFKLENVVPWGRSLQNYCEMFNLGEAEFQGKILDCAGGPSSFNAEMTGLGRSVVSCDPIYQFTVDDLKGRIQATYPVILEGLKTNFERFVWQEVDTPEQLGEVRLAAMRRFLADLPQGLAEGRYLTLTLPELPFPDSRFDLALCAHLLFTYSEQFDFEFHKKAIVELCRVAQEVRIFPLVENFTGERSRHLDPLLDWLTQQQYQWEIQPVAYEFQRGGNEMLRLTL
ncbi:MAG: class I SAM-dependent methyltransferase [Kamptonema sp. SIO4C4]|nr:class I SAM-dependent methyltransferase [Kamptonema sp. SIO4C4]